MGGFLLCTIRQEKGFNGFENFFKDFEEIYVR